MMTMMTSTGVDLKRDQSLTEPDDRSGKDDDDDALKKFVSVVVVAVVAQAQEVKSDVAVVVEDAVEVVARVLSAASEVLPSPIPDLTAASLLSLLLTRLLTLSTALRQRRFSKKPDCSCCCCCCSGRTRSPHRTIVGVGVGVSGAVVVVVVVVRSSSPRLVFVFRMFAFVTNSESLGLPLERKLFFLF